MKTKLKKLPEIKEKKNIEKILNAIQKIAAGDFSARISISDNHDLLDGIAIGINMLGEELEANSQEKNDHTDALVKILEDINEAKEIAKQTKKALEESDKKFRALFESSPVGITIIDLNGTLLNCNDEAVKIIGIQKEKIIGKQFTELNLFKEEDLNNIIEKFSRALNGEKSDVFELQIGAKKNRKWIEVFSTPLKKDDQIYAFQIIIREITDRKRAEEALRKSESRYRILAENATDIIWTMDMDLKFTFISPSVESQCGYTVEEAMALDVEETLTPESFELAMNVFEEEMALENEKEIDLSRSRILELELNCKDGSTIWTEILMTFLRNQNNQLTGIQGIARNITDRRRAEGALRAKEEKYRTLFENSSASITLVDGSSVIVDCNKATEEITGFSRYDLVGQSFEHLITLDPKDIPKLMEKFEKLLKEQKIEPDELEIINKDGEKRWVNISVSPFIKNNKIRGFQIISNDITERKLAEDELKKTLVEVERSNKELEQFAYIASHDLQVPLRMVASYLQLLERRYKDKLDSDAHEFIDYAVNGAKRMQNLINDLLEYSRVSKRRKEFEPINSEEIFNQVLNDLGMMIDDSGAKVTHDKLPLLKADDIQLGQLFQNLLGNAIKFHSDKPPEVHVSVDKNENEWIFSMKDNGIGLNTQYGDRPFMIFQKLHNIEEYPGTGIGLAVCKRIVERHRGRIWFESEPGKGTTFYFTIPVGDINDEKVGNKNNKNS